MAPCLTRGRDQAIARLARRQHGVVARGQLIALGLEWYAIDYRLARARLHQIHRGVYALGHDALTPQARWMAGVLAGGPGAALSHLAAAAHWGIHRTGRPRIEVTVPGRRRPQGRLEFHSSSLPGDEVTIQDGIRVTTVPRTLFDLATALRLRQLERALNEAELQRLWDERSLDDLLRRYPRRAGSRVIRAVIAERTLGMRILRSDLELRFLEFVDRAGLPVPETNVMVEGFEVDCVWRTQGVVVELDGRSTHETPTAFERDRERDRILQTAGWRPVRVTWRQLEHAPERLEADLRRLLAAATLGA